jgi:thiol-disulfide isomerase/thioredoxin
MLWDLVSMRVGSKLPSLLLEDAQGRTVQLDTAMAGATCIAITAGWCSYCDVEIRGLEQLARDYAGIVPITVIGLDTSATAWNNYVKQQPLSNIRWLRALAEQRLREDLRLLSLPAFYLLNDGILARSPAPLPSKGLGALFHQAKVNAEKDGRIKVWDD